MKDNCVSVTVFTPTYNRAYIIENLYNSLKSQTNIDFEWLVVDDGSTDGTELLFNKWTKEESSFLIRYYKKENGGKHTAINKGLELAKGKLFFTVDSDDYLTDDAIEKIIKWESELPKDKKFCGVAGNLGTSTTHTPNTIFPEDYIDGTAMDRYKTIDGERALAFYTNVHRKYMYPIFEEEKFMTEAVAWNRMANDGYSIRYFNDIIWIYEYKEDGLTKAGKSVFFNNPRGYGLWLSEKSAFAKDGILKKIRMIYSFVCDLSDMYNAKMIAKCINAPLLLIKLLISITNAKKLLTKKVKKV